MSGSVGPDPFEVKRGRLSKALLQVPNQPDRLSGTALMENPVCFSHLQEGQLTASPVLKKELGYATTKRGAEIDCILDVNHCQRSVTGTPQQSSSPILQPNDEPIINYGYGLLVVALAQAHRVVALQCMYRRSADRALAQCLDNAASREF